MARSDGNRCASLEHRSPPPADPGFRALRGSDLFERIGGQPTIDKLVDILYDAFENDEQLRPLFPRDLASGRSMQKVFFADWLGGPHRYSEQAYAGLRQRHDGLPITRSLAERWLAHFSRALAASVAAENDRRTIFAAVRPVALALVRDQASAARPHKLRNMPVSKGREGGTESGNSPVPVAWCGVGARSVTQAQSFARRGDTAGLSATLAGAPDLLYPTFAAAIMQTAALAGRTEIVRLLLDYGVAADRPFYLPVAITGVAFERVIFVTPLCAARMKRRDEVESLLLAAGAHEDVFTSAFLGDLSSLTQLLAADRSLARATDPAVDVLDITPVEHAVAGGRASALRLILDRVDGPAHGYVRALRGAAAQASLPMVELLLAHGADATRIGVGRWVLDPALASLLSTRGAAIDSSGSWIGASCTGNQGRKDDPKYVRALLQHGAHATDRRSGGPAGATGVRALNATALHYAAKAGFLETIEVLMEHGADPAAVDSHGRTPLDWLEQAAPSVSRAAVRKLLTSGRPGSQQAPNGKA